MGPFDVTKEMIGLLKDEQLRELLSQLLSAEARERAIPKSAIFVGGNQTANDGGVDASITWMGDPEPSDFLPRRTTYFQCKAETMSAAGVRKEMRPGDTARPIFAKLGLKKGAYIIFSTDDPSASAYVSRKTAMQNAIFDVSNHEQIWVDFYGAAQIAGWTNQHYGVALWLLEVHGRKLGGWQRHGNWSRASKTDSAYLMDKILRVVVDDNKVDVRSALISTRRKLKNAGAAVRLVGQSGLGKTRFAEALFDDQIDPETALSSTRAVYGDIGLELSTSGPEVADQIALSGANAVIVADNCDLEKHNQIRAIVGRPGSNCSLLSMDYDLASEKPIDTMLVVFGTNSEVLLIELLKQQAPSISLAERHHLANLSGGNARIALKIAECASEGIDLSKLNDRELVRRLFQEGRQPFDAASLACAQGASLVNAFYVHDTGSHVAEHSYLANLVDVSIPVFYRNISKFLDWGVIQQRGSQRALMPPPLANMLAAPFIRQSDPEVLLESFMFGPQRLFASFAKRLGQLHDEPAAVRIVEKLLETEGVFGDLSKLNDSQRTAFINSAPAAPEAALVMIERSLRTPSTLSPLSSSEACREEIAKLLVFIANDGALFVRAMEALLTIIIRDDNARLQELFLQRFWPILSRTLADQTTRLAVIDRLLDDPDGQIELIGVKAIGYMLKPSHFSSSVDLEIGARPALREWRPPQSSGYNAWYAGYIAWYTAAYERATQVAASESAFAETARALVVRNFREHVDIGIKDPAISAMRQVCRGKYWDDGWRVVSETLRFSRTALSPDTLAEIVTLERDLRPKSRFECFEAFALGKGFGHWHPNGRTNCLIRRSEKLAEASGLMLGRSGESVIPYLSEALVAEQSSNVWAFGRGLGRGTNDLDNLWEMACSEYANEDGDRRNVSVLCGILEGAARGHANWVDARLAAAVDDRVLSESIVSLHLAVEFTAASVTRLIRALESGSVDPVRFRVLQMGGTTSRIPASSLVPLLGKLSCCDEGKKIALEILHMRMYSDESSGEPASADLMKLACSFLAEPDVYVNLGKGDEVAEIAKHALSGATGVEIAAVICRAIIRAHSDLRLVCSDGLERVCATITSKHPRVVLDEVALKPIGDDLLFSFFGGHCRDDDDISLRFDQFNAEVALDWLNEDPDIRSARLASLIQYKAVENGSFVWSPLAIALINRAPDPVIVLTSFQKRFQNGGGFGTFSSKLVRRRPLLEALLRHGDQRIRNWARSASETLEEDIRRWEKMESHWESRFE